MKYLAIAAALFALAIPASATECPEGVKSCKILILNDEQASVLKQMVTNTAVQGPFSQIKALVDFYGDLIDKAPAGEVKKTDANANPAAKK